MHILFYCPWHDKHKWLKLIKKKFKKYKIVTLNENLDFAKIDYAIIWELPNEIYKKLYKLKLIFSLGAGVDHIINLSSYNKIPIIRLKNKFMAERMSNHVISQILEFQLNLKLYKKYQKQSRWVDFKEPVLNKELSVGILGLGYLGYKVGQTLSNMGYNVFGFKRTKPKSKLEFDVYFQAKNLIKFIQRSDIIISVLPNTKETVNIINKKFLKYMKKKSLLINVGRGSSVNEKDLINHLKKNKHFSASLDVFKNEPLNKKSNFWKMSNVNITPHVASITEMNTAVDYMYKRFNEYKKNKKFKSDVNLKKGY